MSDCLRVCPYSFLLSFRCLSHPPIPVFLRVCLSFCLSEFLIPYLSYSISFTLSLSAYLSDSLFLCTHLICFHFFSANVFLIPSFHSFFPLTLISHRYHNDHAVMILMFWWSWLIIILTFNNINMANVVWIALNLVGFDLSLSLSVSVSFSFFLYGDISILHQFDFYIYLKTFIQ